MTLTADETALLDAARAAAGAAYAPYSGFHVGAAVRAEDGRVFTAANVENASYGLSLCAEANAVAAAAVAGARVLTHVAVVGYRVATPDAAALAHIPVRLVQSEREDYAPESKAGAMSARSDDSIRAGSALAMPCGRCRQMIAEFATPATRVLVADRAASEVMAIPFADLLPHAFGPRTIL